MENLLIICLMVIATVSSQTDNYRLPGNIIPLRYDIRLTIPPEALTGGVTSFTGSETIRFNLTAITNTILIHSLVNFLPSDVTVFGITETAGEPVALPYSVSNVVSDITTEITTITLAELPINTYTYYTLTINEYTGNLDTANMMGFYRSQYNVVNTGTNTNIEYLALTQFEPTHARRAFPCFDEPQYKAVFALVIMHPADFNAVANTIGISAPITATITTTAFEDTPLISTHTLAFAVSKFTCNSQILGAGINVVSYGACSRLDQANKRDLALNYGGQVISALDTWTGVPYSSMNIGKIHQFAVPDFRLDAMGNLGLVIYREDHLLYDELHASNQVRQEILSTIAHEFASMWFGNRITTLWWDNLFLNKGFAAYFEYFIINQIRGFESFEMDKQFIIDRQQSALVSDGFISSESLSSEVLTTDHITRKFSTVSSTKGASIFRMVENVVGSANFQAAIRQYITQYALNSVTPDLLWANFNLNSYPNINFNFANFIDTWTNRPGYPVINASVDGNNIVLTQERFLYSDTDTTSTRWYVPIDYRQIVSRTLHVSATQSAWLVPNIALTIENGAADNNLILLNQGYFRVNYDNTLRQRITSMLQTNHLAVSDIDRAQIIDDSFNLARSGHIMYSDALQMLNYLRNESSYYPWRAAINGLNFLASRIGQDSELRGGLNRRILELIWNVSIDLWSINWALLDHVTSIKLGMIFTAACRAGQETCLLESTRLFQNLMTNNININPNIREAVYCNALRQSNAVSDWDYLWNRLQTVNDPHETKYIRESLGCTTNRSQLTTLLDQTIAGTPMIRKQDFISVWRSVFSSSSVGLEVAFQHFTTNFANILLYYPDALSILSEIAGLMSTEAEITLLESFVTQQEAGSVIAQAASSALTSARSNLEWQVSIESDLRTALDLPQIDNVISAASAMMSLSLIVASLFVISSVLLR